MKKRRIPLQRLVTYIVLAIFLLVFSVLSVFSYREYSYLIEEQGGKILTMHSDNTERELKNMLEGVQVAAELYSDQIDRMEVYKNKDMDGLLDYSLPIAKMLQRNTPQISSIHYAGVNGSTAGYLLNDDGSISLVLWDPSTHGRLVIYEDDEKGSKEKLAIEMENLSGIGWYEAAMAQPARHWTGVSVIWDEGPKLGMDYVGALSAEEEIVAVVGMGINMDELNQFLSEDSGMGITYICDAGGKVVANSTGKDLVEYRSELPPEAYPEDALDSSDLGIRESARFIKENRIPYDQTFRITIKGIRYFGMISMMDKLEDEGFCIVNLVPESDIVGEAIENQKATLGIVTLIFLAGMLIVSLVLRKVLKPILHIAEKASQITDENFGELIKEPKNSVTEIHALIEALNRIIGKIQQSVMEIKASEKNFRSLVENSDDFIFNLTPSGKIISSNESFSQFVQKDRGGIIGESIALVIAGRDNQELWQEQWQEQWEKMINMQSKATFSFDAVNSDNEKRLLNVQLIPQFDDSGRLTDVIGTFTDVTELIENRQKIEELLMHENERLEAQIEIKTRELNETMKELMEREKLASLGSLVAGISHEINTPLGVAVSACSFLADENRKVIKIINSGSLTREGLAGYLENADESTRIIQNNLNRAAGLIASFKSISVDQSSEKEVSFNLYDYIQSILLMLKHEYKNTGHKIEVDCPEDLFISSYPGAVSQIFTNLIMNSLIHGFKGVETGTISIKVDSEIDRRGNKKKLHIAYRDDGVGIPEENLKHIFDPFFTTARGTGTKSGSGLGLNILYNLITSRLEGSVKCESEPGKGVLFSMVIPYK